jgi:predicted dehydrogenase
MKRLYPGVDVCQSFDEVLSRSDVDAVAIATPTRLHYSMALKALESGRHVLVEKPLTTSVQECESLLETAEDRSLILMVGHTFLYFPTVRKIREIIQQGDLGELQYVSA